MRVGVLYSRIRAEEKLLVQELENRGVDYEMIDVRKSIFNLNDYDEWNQYDVVLERCVSHSRALASLQILGGWGIPTVNSLWNDQTSVIMGDYLYSKAFFLLVEYGLYEVMSILALSASVPSANSPAFIRSNKSRFSSTGRSRYGLSRPGSVRVPRCALISSAVSSST